MISKKKEQKKNKTLSPIFSKTACLVDIRIDVNNNHVINTQIAAEAVSTSTIDD